MWNAGDVDPATSESHRVFPYSFIRTNYMVNRQDHIERLSITGVISPPGVGVTRPPPGRGRPILGQGHFRSHSGSPEMLRSSSQVRAGEACMHNSSPFQASISPTHSPESVSSSSSLLSTPLCFPQRFSPVPSSLGRAMANLTLRSPRSIPNISRRECKFCKNNGESIQMYTSHTLRNPQTNLLVCPVLRSHECEICHATGDEAHTRNYCPLEKMKRRKALPLALKETDRQSNGQMRQNY